MKIAFLSLSEVNSFNGGAELWLNDIANSLIKKGNDVHIYVPSKNKMPNYYLGDLKIIPFRSRLFSLLTIIKKVNIYPLFLYTKLNENYDILYINTMSSIITPLFYRKSLVIGTHDCFSSNDKFILKDVWRKFVPIFLLVYGSKRIKIHALDNFVASFFKVSKKKPLFSHQQ